MLRDEIGFHRRGRGLGLSLRLSGWVRLGLIVVMLELLRMPTADGGDWFDGRFAFSLAAFFEDGIRQVSGILAR